MTIDGSSAWAFNYNEQLFGDGFTFKTYFRTQNETDDETHNFFSLNEETSDGEYKSILFGVLDKSLNHSITFYNGEDEEPVLRIYYTAGYWNIFTFSIVKNPIDNLYYIHVLVRHFGLSNRGRTRYIESYEASAPFTEDKDASSRFILLGGAFFDGELNPNSTRDTDALEFKKSYILNGGLPFTNVDSSLNCEFISGISEKSDHVVCLQCEEGYYLQDNICVEECSRKRSVDDDLMLCSLCYPFLIMKRQLRYGSTYLSLADMERC